MPVLDQLRSLFASGGWVMWPLLGLSLASVTLIVERSLFWVATHGPSRGIFIQRVNTALRARRGSEASALAGRDRTVYGRYVSELAGAMGTDGSVLRESVAREAAERVRPAVERFSATLSTIVTAAPMLGILGTVTGIIQSFRLLGGAEVVTDPAVVASGIAEALFTTAFGLLIALGTLFPHALFRAQAERCLTRLELLASAALEGAGGESRS